MRVIVMTQAEAQTLEGSYKSSGRKIILEPIPLLDGERWVLSERLLLSDAIPADKLAFMQSLPVTDIARSEITDD